ncbi:phosphotransferase [Coniochaeta sp. 2T2.1]|nr:phosphotransferase [Coniochaeta sp. 2T2.1]
MYKERQDFDDVAWDKSDAAEEKCQKRMRKESTCRKVEAFVMVKCGKPATVVSVIQGGYNTHYRLRFEGEDSSSDIMARVPRPTAAAVSPGKKVFYEAATAEYIRLNTRVPSAQVLHFARDSDIGAFLIMCRVENRGNITQPLTIPDRDINLTPALNPNLHERKLRSLWRAGVVAGRPLTQNMSNMRRLANIRTAIFPAENKTFATADEWYLELANMHLSQLVFQHNDLVSSEDDCRNKYVARQLFRRLAKQGCLSTFGFAEDDWSADAKTTTRCRFPAPDGSGPFRLWCDDFRPANALLDRAQDEDKLAAVIDWEFTYAAPVQFVLDPPWWLLFETPEMWEPSGDKEQEEGPRARAAFLDGRPLSAHMRESWETGRFWFNYAAKKSWAFDAVFWTFLDERFFGPRDPEVADKDLWRTRLDLLGQGEQQAMEPLVKQKMDESRERILIEWDPDEARKRLSELLFD